MAEPVETELVETPLGETSVELVETPPRLAHALAALTRWRDRGVHFVGIRHHSPGCAAALATLLDEVRPAVVLIEGPREYDRLLPTLADARTVPPVAVLSVGERQSAFYPLADFSPEWVALRWGMAAGATVRFFDASYSDDPDADEVRTLQAEHHLARSELIAAVAAALMALFIWGIVLYGIWRIYKARMAFREMNAAASMLQLQALQAQMNPHFIGNSINAIQQFMHPPDPIKISEYISIFTRLLRRTMLFSEKTFIPFEEELAYDREYLQMIQLRFGERVQLEISGVGAIPPETPVPSMLLQPILENATIHGLAQDGISQIKLRFSLLQDDFKCELTDNGMGFKETQRIKQVAGSARVSKGLAMLRTKIETLNRLYDLDIAISVTDLSETEPAQHGTKACITFNVKKIWKAAKSRPGPGSPESLR